MSEKFLPRVDYQEESGFRTALFVSLPFMEPNYRTPVRDYKEEEYSMLSIEITPGTTPKAGNRQATVSNFLSRDLLRKLEDGSPVKLHSKAEQSSGADIFLVNCEGENEDNQYDFEASMKMLCGNQSLYNNESNSTAEKSQRNMILRDDCEKLSSEKKAYPFYADQNFSNNINSPVYYNDEYFSTPIKNLNAREYELESKDMRSNYFTEDTTRMFNNLTIKSDEKDMKNNMTGNQAYYNMVYGINSQLLNNYKQNYNNNMMGNVGAQTAKPTALNNNPLGKQGWVCISCNNFNYESKLFF